MDKAYKTEIPAFLESTKLPTKALDSKYRYLLDKNTSFSNISPYVENAINHLTTQVDLTWESRKKGVFEEAKKRLQSLMSDSSSWETLQTQVINQTHDYNTAFEALKAIEYVKANRPYPDPQRAGIKRPL